jgi:integration host factor subunit beta
VNKSDLIHILSERYGHIPFRDIELAVKGLVEHMSDTLSSGDRIEIRGFGSFSIRYRQPRAARNPKTGTRVELGSKYVPHFKPGKELREKVNDSAQVDS